MTSKVRYNGKGSISIVFLMFCSALELLPGTNENGQNKLELGEKDLLLYVNRFNKGTKVTSKLL